MKNIDKWMDVARKYGATFENLTLVPEDDSFTVRAIEKEKPIRIEVPSPVLLSEGDMEITDSVHRVKEGLDIPVDLRKMFNEYLDFILSEKRIARQVELVNGFVQMPDSLKNELIPFAFASLYAPQTRKDLKIKLIQARTIIMHAKGGRRFLMPFIDFMNHHPKAEGGLPFQVGNNSIVVQGQALADGDICAVYNDMVDPFAYLQTYYFVPNAVNALGMNITIQVDEKTKLTIGRRGDKIRLDNQALSCSEYSVSIDNTITFYAFWIGSKGVPRHPFWSFKQFWEGQLHRNDTLRIYTILKSLNITKLVNIIRECDKTKQSMTVQLVRECALQQLNLIGESYEMLPMKLPAPATNLTTGT